MAYVQGESLKVMLPSSTVFNSRLLRRPQDFGALKSTLETDMAKTVTYEFDNMNDIFDSLEDTISALHGFSGLLDLALHDSGDLQPYADGVARLLDQQVTALVRVREAARQEVEKLRTEKLPPLFNDDIEAIARLAGVHKGAAARVMFVLTGKDLAGDAYKREGEMGTYRLDRHLLERRVYDVLNNSVEWGRVSLETGLDLYTVQAVFLSMLNSPGIEARPRPIEDIREALLQHIGADDLHRVATKLGLDADTVYNVVISLAIPDSAEPETEEEAPKAEQPKPADMRKAFIADKLKNGVDAGQIAQALNMKRATVERVIGQLMAGQASPDPDQQATNG